LVPDTYQTTRRQASKRPNTKRALSPHSSAVYCPSGRHISGASPVLIALASDHAGFSYQERVKLFLIEAGHVIEDFGVDSEQPADYPLCIRPCAEAVAAGEADRGIIFGGSGNGEAIVANRVPGIRCTLCWNVKSAQFA